MPILNFQNIRPEFFGAKSWYDLIPQGTSPSDEYRIRQYLQQIDEMWPTRLSLSNRARYQSLMNRILEAMPQPAQPTVPPKPEVPYVPEPQINPNAQIDPNEQPGLSTTDPVAAENEANRFREEERAYTNPDQPGTVTPPVEEPLTPGQPPPPDQPRQGYFGNTFYSPSPQDGNMPHLYQWDPTNGGYQDKGRVSLADLERAEQSGGVKIVGDIGQMKQLASQGGAMTNAQWDAQNAPQSPQAPSVGLFNGMTYRGGQVYDATGRARTSIDAATRMRLQGMGYTFDAGANRYFGPGESAQPQTPDTPATPYVQLPQRRKRTKPKSSYVPQPAHGGATAAGLY